MPEPKKASEGSPESRPGSGASRIDVLGHALRFLDDNYRRLPARWRVFAYFVVLFAVLYAIFGPAFIDARLVVAESDGDYAMRDAAIEVDYSGRTLRLRVDDDGRFSFPLPSRLPFAAFRTQIVLDEMAGQIRSMRLPMLLAFADRAVIRYDRKAQKFSLDRGDGLETIAQWIIPAAMAAPQTGRDTVAPVAANADAADGIDATARALVADIKGVPSSQIASGARLRSDLGFTNVELSLLSGKLQKRYRVDLWNVFRGDPSLDDLSRVTHEAYYDDARGTTWLGDRQRESLERMIAAEDRFPPEDVAAFRTARLERKAGHLGQAIAMLSNLALKYADDFYLVHFNLGLSYDAANDAAKAEAAYARSVAIADQRAETDPAVLNTYGRFLYRQNRCQDAVGVLERVASMDPERPFIAEYVGDARECIQTGRPKPVHR